MEFLSRLAAPFVFLYQEARTFVVWLGKFASDPDKGLPSTKNGIMLMSMTTLCLGFLTVVGVAAYKTPGMLHDLVIPYGGLIASAGGLTYVFAKRADNLKKRKEKENAGQDTEPSDAGR